MRFVKSACAGMAVAGLGVVAAQASPVIVPDVSIRADVFVPSPFSSSGYTVNGSGFVNNTIANPLNTTFTLEGLDLDMDGTANDSVTVNVQWNSPDDGLRIFNQGVDTGFGTLDAVTASVTEVIGTTTDQGLQIVFDGFTGGTIGGGGPNDVSGSAEVNGNLLNFAAAAGFAFGTNSVDFAPTPTVTFTNGTATADGGAAVGSVVARALDLQFSAVVPEPASLALLGLGGLAMLARGRRA